MKTVHEVSRIAGVSVRTLHHYDAIGLLKPTTTTEKGYRLYDSHALQRLQSILLFRELKFPLKEIKAIMDSPQFDLTAALEQQLHLLMLEKERLEKLIVLATDYRDHPKKGENHMDFSAFDTKKTKEYQRQAREKWGETDAYREFEKKAEHRSDEQNATIGSDLMVLFRELGALRNGSPDSAEAQAAVGKIRAYITEHFYDCTPEIFGGLGQMYEAGGEMTDNIDLAGGPGTAAFAAAAIRVYCEQKH